MKTIFKAACCLACLTLLATVLSAASKDKLAGAWKVVEVTTSGPNAGTITNAQPGLWIFTKKHYSIMHVMSDKPRPDFPQQNATEAQLVAAWGPFAANSGTYEVKGTTLTSHPMVAKNPGVMAPGRFTTWDFKIEGNTLSITQKANYDGPIANPSRFKLIRVE